MSKKQQNCQIQIISSLAYIRKQKEKKKRKARKASPETLEGKKISKLVMQIGRL